jgi:hypothetical protein
VGMMDVGIDAGTEGELQARPAAAS